MSVRRFTAIGSVIALSACAGVRSHVETPHPVDDAPIAVVATLPRRALPLPRASVRNTAILWNADNPAAYGSEDGRYVLFTGRSLVFTDRHFVPVSTTAVPFDEFAVLAVDDDLARVVTADGVFDVASESYLETPPGRRILGAEGPAERCVVRREEDPSALAVEPCVGSATSVRVVVDGAAIARRVSGSPQGSTDSNVSTNSVRVNPTAPRAALASLDGNLLGVVFRGVRTTVCTYELPSTALLGCVAIPEFVREVAVSDAEGTVCVNRGAECRDARTPDLAPWTGPPRTGFYFDTVDDRRVVRRAPDGAVVAPDVPDDATIAVGESTYLVMRAGVVELFDAEHSLGTITLAESLATLPDLSPILYQDDVVFVTPSGLAAARVGDVDVDLGVRLRSPGVLLARETTFSVENDVHGVFFESDRVHGVASAEPLGATGESEEVVVVSEPGAEQSATAESADAGATTSDEEDPYALERAVSERYQPAMLSGSRDTPSGVRLALVDPRGRVQLVNERGDAVGAPIRLPSRVARSRCTRIEFLSDVDLILAGSAPCIPTRIRLDTRRTEALGLARVAIEHATDGSRAVLLADRKVTIVDGHTGATLAGFDPGLEHPRLGEVDAAASAGVVEGSNGFVTFVLAPAPADAAGAGPRLETRRFESDGELATYADAASRLVVRCAPGGRLRIEPFTGADAAREVASRACAALAAGDDEASPIFASIGAVIGIQSNELVTFVRAADLATLEVEVVMTDRNWEMLVLEGETVVGASVDEPHVFVGRDPDGTRFTIEADAEVTDAAIRSFFAGP